jgi:hypothetical protein
VTVTGTNNPAQTVTWSITTSGTASGTSISNAGLLTVAVGETQTAIEVKAISTVDPTKSGTRTVTVTASSGDPVLPGSIRIDVVIDGFVDTTAEAITEATMGEFDFLTATYFGWETVTYQWKKDGVDLLLPGIVDAISVNSPGTYTVTVSAEGYQSKTSAPVTVTGGSSGGKLTITGLEDINGKYICATGSSSTFGLIGMGDRQKNTGVLVSGGKAELNVYKLTLNSGKTQYEVSDYSGSDSNIKFSIRWKATNNFSGWLTGTVEDSTKFGEVTVSFTNGSAQGPAQKE